MFQSKLLNNKMTKFLKLIGTILYGSILLALITIGALVGISATNIPAGVKLYTVQSGSMEPVIHVGSLVVARPSKDYQRGDIVTFKSEKDRLVANPKSTTTHRIFDIRTTEGIEEYITKGDANATADLSLTKKDLVLGKVFFSIPFLGYPVTFAKTKEGLILLIVIPATLIIYSELVNIKDEAKRLLKERRERKLSLSEKIELGVGEEEIKTERFYKRLLTRLPWPKLTVQPKKKKTL